MNNLKIEFWAYIPVFFPFHFFLSYHLAWSLKDLRKGKNLKVYKRVCTAVSIASFLAPAERRLHSGPPGSLTVPTVSLKGSPYMDTYVTEWQPCTGPLLKGGSRTCSFWGMSLSTAGRRPQRQWALHVHSHLISVWWWIIIQWPQLFWTFHPV